MATDQRAAHPNLVCPNVLPAEAEDLAAPHARVDRTRKGSQQQRLLFSGDVEELLHLGSCPGVDIPRFMLEPSCDSGDDSPGSEGRISVKQTLLDVQCADSTDDRKRRLDGARSEARFELGMCELDQILTR